MRSHLELIHQELRAHVLADGFPCVAAKSAFRNGSYRFRAYRSMGGRASRDALASDLATFADDFFTLGEFATFVASFESPRATTEQRFDKKLWSLLGALNRRDACAWDPLTSSDPEDPSFGFSFHGTAFFVVGMHAASARLSRRFAYPTLVFNAHEQFDALRWQDRYDRVRNVVRARDVALQGTKNPTLDDFGVRSEARQYTSVTTPSWRCPFHSKKRVA